MHELAVSIHNKKKTVNFIGYFKKAIIMYASVRCAD